MQDNPLWQYSLQVYGREGVKQLLLRLQDTYNADANVLLCCCWLGQQSQPLSSELVSRVLAVAADWREECVLPLRVARRFLKEQSGLDDFYRRAKQLELDAEHQQQDKMAELLVAQLGALEVFGDQVGENLAPLIYQNLQRYISTLKVEVDASLLNQLVSAIYSEA